MGICSSKDATIVIPHHSSHLSEEEDSSSHRSTGIVQKENIQNHYTLKKILGTGYFGHVRLAVRFDGVVKEKYAVKSIAKEKVTEKHMLDMELSTLHTMDHPNIIQLYEVFEDERYIHLVTELCTGGELFEKISKVGRFSEAETASLVYKLLHALNYMHNMNVSHRDIKPENIMFSSHGEVKLIDFGLASKFAEGTEMESIVGTPYYVAPEVLHKKYGRECDIWSLGVIMYFMLSGYLPFDGNSRKEIYIKILEAQYDFEGIQWESISSRAKDLISSMLCKSRRKRITAAQALEHPWVVEFMEESNLKQENKVFKRISRASTGGALRSDIMTLISRHLNADEIDRLNRIFRSIDTHHYGYITYQEFEEAANRISMPFMREVFDRIGSDGVIHYSEFIKAAMDRRVLYDTEMRWMTFKFFDSDDKGYITVESMKFALEKLEHQVTDQQVIKMIQEAGLKYDKWIDFSEFCKILEPLPDEISSASANNSEHSLFLR